MDELLFAMVSVMMVPFCLMGCKRAILACSEEIFLMTVGTLVLSKGGLGRSLRGHLFNLFICTLHQNLLFFSLNLPFRTMCRRGFKFLIFIDHSQCGGPGLSWAGPGIMYKKRAVIAFADINEATNFIRISTSIRSD